MSKNHSHNDRFNAALAEYLRRVDAGETVDQTEFVKAHPDVAEELRSYFQMSQVVQGMADPTAEDRDGDAVPLQHRGTIAPAREHDSTESHSSNSAVSERLGRYKIERVLGKGAMGAVYLAVDSVLERRVALKLPKMSANDDSELLKRFEQEAKAAATLSHPGICQVYDVGEVDGRQFIAMAYVEGRPLSKYIAADTQQPQDRIAVIVRKLAVALEHAHQRGIVHRDLKPSNIMLSPTGGPIIMDFGLARRAHSGEERLTRSGAILGTPAYMSPEQIEDAANIKPASDVYSLGVILFELLTGRLPFSGTVAGVAGQILTKAPPRPSEYRDDIDPRLEDLCLAMMNKSPGDRPTSMQEVADRLSEILKSPTPAANFRQDSDGKASTAASESAGRGDKSVVASTSAMSVPVLQQKLHMLTRKGRHRQAVEWLEKLAGGEDTQSEELQDWIRTQLEQVKQNRKKIADQVEAAGRAAADMLRQHDYPTAIAMLQEIPEELRTDQLRRQLRQAIELQDEVELLLNEIEEAMSARAIDGLLPNVERYLRLKPGHERIQTLQQRLKSYRAGQAYRYDKRGELLEYRPDSSWIWKAVVGVALLSGSVYLGVTTFSTPTGSREEDSDNLARATPAASVTRPAAEPETDRPAPEPEVNPERTPPPVPSVEESWLSFAWLQQRLIDTDIDTLLAEISDGADDPDVATVQAALNLSQSSLRDDKSRLWIELRSRTLTTAAPRIEEMLGQPPREVVLIPRFPLCEQAGAEGPERTASAGSTATCIALSSDGEVVVTGHSDGTLDVWNLETGKKLQQLSGHTDEVTDVALSADGATAVSCSRDKQLRVWELASGEATGALQGHLLEVTSVALSADGRTAISGSRDNTVKVWDLVTGEEVRTLRNHQGPVNSVALSSDGRTAASVAGDNTLRIWSLPRGKEQRVIEVRSHEFVNVDLSRDGKRALTGGHDNLLQVWDVESGRELSSIEALDASTAVLTHDGTGVLGELLARPGVGFCSVVTAEVQNQAPPIEPIAEDRAYVEIATARNHVVAVRMGGSVDFYHLLRGTGSDAPPPMAVAPFNADEAVRRQAAWADHLELPVTEITRVGLELQLIPPGEFVMGSPDSEPERESDEGPQHRVRITQPFYLGKLAVTQEQWRAVIGSAPSNFSATRGGADKVSGMVTSRFPVERVTWLDAAHFCNQLSVHEGLPPYYSIDRPRLVDQSIVEGVVNLSGGNGYRLPTEAEWEYACRAGTTTPFHFGSVCNGTNANINGNRPYGTSEKGPFLDRTAMCGSYAPNAFGLHDMHGNLWEWCLDGYDPDQYAERGSISSDPTALGNYEHRVVRGGSWNDNGARHARSANRASSDPHRRGPFQGFRVARNP